MSKLFEQLKAAAKLRESAAPAAEKTTLLQRAMERAASDAARATSAASIDPVASPAPAAPASDREAGADDLRNALADEARVLRWGGIAIATATVAFVAAWQLGAFRSAAPSTDAIARAAPPAWPGMKIERTLDLTRTGGATRSSPPGPAPSR